jgi:bifunctional UDP-N-acetylglucosamine pyrophosphorylase/glucosamine-1-phosphate N-acetyltransferase
MLAKHRETGAAMTLVTVVMDTPTGYGRIIRDDLGNLIEIVEEKNATEEQKAIREINSGNGVYDIAFLREVLPTVEKNELTGEYYLTDVVKLGLANGYTIDTLTSDDHRLSVGVNTPEQYAEAEKLMHEKLTPAKHHKP